MKFMKFIIINRSDSQQTDEKVAILINPDHIVSIKPIKMTTAERNIVDGYWLRLSNGKKYKAIQIPQIVKNCFFEELPSVSLSDNNIHEINLQ